MISTSTTTTPAANRKPHELAPRRQGARLVGEQASLPRPRRTLRKRPARYQRRNPRRQYPSSQPRRQRPPQRRRRAPQSRAAQARRTRRRLRSSAWIGAPRVRGHRGAALPPPLRLRRRPRHPRLRARARQQPHLRARGRLRPHLRPRRRKRRPQARPSAGGCRPAGAGVDWHVGRPLPEQEGGRGAVRSSRLDVHVRSSRLTSTWCVAADPSI
jgi:hypothetical protein